MSQNDPAWRFTIMQTGGDTIGNYGCALTSTTMLLNYYGAVMSPDQLSACLGSDADLLHWAQVNHCTNGIVRFQDDLDFTWEAIDAQLAAGTPVIVGFRGGPAGMHFVVVTAGAGGDGANYAVTDPWDASTDKTLRYFMVRGYVPTWIVVYSGPGRNCTTRLIPGIGPPSHPPAAATAARPLGTPIPEGTATPRPAGTIPPAAGAFPQTWRTPNQALPLALSPTPAPRSPTATARSPAR